MTFPIVFFDLAGPEPKALKDFYSSVFSWELDPAGNVNVPTMSPLTGTIRVGDEPPRLFRRAPGVTHATIARVC